MLNVSMLKKIAGNKVFSVSFIKKSGELSKMVCRFGASKGVNGKGMRYNTAEKNYATVYKFDKKNSGFRTLVVENIVEVKIKGVKLSKQQLDALSISIMQNEFRVKYDNSNLEKSLENAA